MSPPSDPVPFAELMALERIDSNTFRSLHPAYQLRFTPIPGGPVGASVPQVRAYGGHVYAQAMLAASRTVKEGFVIHGVTGFFTAPADASPFTYRVRSIGDGRGFVIRAVEASQKGVICFTCTCGFKRKDQDGIKYQADYNTAGAPGELVGMHKPWEHTRRWGIQVPGSECTDSPRERPFPGLVLTEPDLHNYNANRRPHDRRRLHFYTATGPLPSVEADPNLHAAAHLYASDFETMIIILYNLELERYWAAAATLCHTVIFHTGRQALAMSGGDKIEGQKGKELGERWFCQESWSDRAEDDRGMHHSRIWDESGRHVATTMQDGLIRAVFKKKEEREQVEAGWRARGKL